MQKGQSSATLMLRIPNEQAAVLAQDHEGALAADDLHITLLYLGEADQFDRDELLELMRSFVREIDIDYLAGSVNGTGQFDNGDEEIAVFAIPDVPALPALRQLLVEHFEAAGHQNGSQHGYVPHITLLYKSRDDDFEPVIPYGLNINFGGITLSYNGRFETVNFQEEAMSRTTFLDRALAMAARFVPSLFSPVERTAIKRDLALSIAQSQIWHALDEMDQRNGTATYLLDIYLGDDGQTYVVAMQNMMLYRASLDIESGVAVFGEWQRVAETYVPVPDGTARTTVIEKDGRPLIIQIAATSVINKAGEIDSTELFDNFVKRASETGQWPLVDFMHTDLIVGRVVEDGIMRDGNCLINVWQFDDSEMGRLFQAAYMKNPDQWGGSIYYMPMMARMVEVADGITIPVYTDGVQERLALCTVEDACNFFTGNKIVRRTQMNKKTRAALAQLLDGDEEAIALVEGQIDRTNGEIAASGAIARTTEEVEEVEEETAVTTEEVEEVEEETTEEEAEEGDASPASVVIDLGDEEVERAVATAIVGLPEFGEQVAALPVLRSLTDDSEKLGTTVLRQQELIKKLVARIEKLEELVAEEDEDRKARFLTSLPTIQITHNGSHRPRKARAEAEEEGGDDQEQSYEDIAKATASRLKNAFKGKSAPTS